MSERRISYLDRNFDDYRQSILDITRKYYSDVYDNLDDASVGSWFVDLLADIADNLSYNIDRAYQETSVDSANERHSLLSLARSNGCKVGGKKAAIVEVAISCDLPTNKQGVASDGVAGGPDESYAPLLRRGMQFSNGAQTFELMNDVDFSHQFDDNGISNRKILPLRDSNNNIVGYRYTKLAIAMAGQTKIYKKVITESDIHPFMEVVIEDSDILGVESIIVKEGTDLGVTPNVEEFYVDEESYTDGSGRSVERFFEVENLVEQYRFGHEVEKDDKGMYATKWVDDVVNVEVEDGDEKREVPVTIRKIAKGKWKKFKNKFVTEYTDNWNLRIIFGKGLKNEYGEIPENASDFTQYMMCRMMANDYMGVLPEAGKTMYIMYRTGGGEQSNIAKDTLRYIIFKNLSIDGNCNDNDDSTKKMNVMNSLSVTNTSPSYGGKDEPTASEMRRIIKYNNSSQNRCVTVHDYYARIMQIPAKFGCPFRCGVVEENNKIVIYTLGLDYRGNLSNELSEQVAENMKNYLSNYKMVNDFVEIRSGKIINISVEADVFIEKTYDRGDVIRRVINTIYDYFDIHKWNMGEDIFIGDLEKEISKLDGVQNLIELRVYNKVGDGYSNSVIMQDLVSYDNCGNQLSEYEPSEPTNRVDLKSSDKVLFSECNSMFEIKYKSKDITVTAKQR